MLAAGTPTEWETAVTKSLGVPADMRSPALLDAMIAALEREVARTLCTGPSGWYGASGFYVRPCALGPRPSPKQLITHHGAATVRAMLAPSCRPWLACRNR